MPDPSLSTDLRTLTKHLVIRDVRYNELRVKAEAIPDDELMPPVFRLEIQIAHEPKEDEQEVLQAHVALNVELTVSEGRIAVEPVAFFHIPTKYAAALNPRSLTAYVNETGIFHVLPFARQALLDVSSRVFQNPVLMPIFRPGDINFELPPVEDNVKNEEPSPNS